MFPIADSPITCLDHNYEDVQKNGTKKKLIEKEIKVPNRKI